MRRTVGKFKPSPAPWLVWWLDTRIAIKSGKRTIAYVGIGPEEHDNAHLIANAPELLALAHQYASECGDCGGTRIVPGDDGQPDERCEQCADVWAVIDKAEGRSGSLLIVNHS